MGTNTAEGGGKRLRACRFLLPACSWNLGSLREAQPSRAHSLRANCVLCCEADAPTTSLNAARSVLAVPNPTDWAIDSSRLSPALEELLRKSDSLSPKPLHWRDSHLLVEVTQKAALAHCSLCCHHRDLQWRVSQNSEPTLRPLSNGGLISWRDGRLLSVSVGTDCVALCAQALRAEDRSERPLCGGYDDCLLIPVSRHPFRRPCLRCSRRLTATTCGLAVLRPPANPDCQAFRAAQQSRSASQQPTSSVATLPKGRRARRAWV